METEKRNSTKYHKVKFFERVKLDRQLKNARAALDQSPPDSAERAEAERAIEKCVDDLAYVKFFPKERKYVSLFIGDDADTVRRREASRKLALAARDADLLAANARVTAKADDDDDDAGGGGGSGDDDDAAPGDEDDDDEGDDAFLVPIKS